MTSASRVVDNAVYYAENLLFVRLAERCVNDTFC
jgi:hypothetical protein